MACECFDEQRLARCTAVAGTLVPTHHERERYCRGDGKHDCPTYRLYQLRGARLSQDAYYALWMTPVPETSPAGEPAEPVAARV
jgi:hypothetical protein